MPSLFCLYAVQDKDFTPLLLAMSLACSLKSWLAFNHMRLFAIFSSDLIHLKRMAEQSAKLLEICLENPLLKNLVKALAEELSTNQNEEEDWITTEEAMSILKISSKTTLKKYRDQNDIKYSAPIGSKHILYSKSSLLKFIEDKANMP